MASSRLLARDDAMYARRSSTAKAYRHDFAPFADAPRRAHYTIPPANVVPFSTIAAGGCEIPLSAKILPPITTHLFAQVFPRASNIRISPRFRHHTIGIAHLIVVDLSNRSWGCLFTLLCFHNTRHTRRRARHEGQIDGFALMISYSVPAALPK